MIYTESNDSDLFERFETGEVPDEKDPFCNQTENRDFSESYSHVIPSFFFRNEKCRKKPSSYEKRKLRYFYNITGILLISKLFIEIASLLLFSIIMALLAYFLSPGLNFFYSALSDETIKYAFRIIVVIISSGSVFLAGCRFSELKPAHLLKGCRTVRTSDIILCFMTGMFVAALSNIITLSYPFQSGTYMPSALYIDRDPILVAAAALCNCVVVPLADGLIFRGIALKNLSRASQRFGIITSSMLCAFATCSLPAMLPAFLMSLLLCSTTVKYNSVIPSVLIHMAVNISSMLISVYSVFAWDQGELLVRVWTIITLVLGGIFTFIRMIKEPLPKNKPEQRRRSLPILLTSVFVILLFPLYALTSLAKLLYFMYM
ncbi:CPBP family intramembrane glutamic endopeptidase [Ruminococcus sp. HUN007]|uniref:CPBP family intramembrane glutamic endopeptidase n=1 Tax=Ruminococcus sp. HUN007 TaxID=1514668 RepID=UPI0005D18721|nr:CPBP family intramembrane glutamic endopeptidase [Ruminococcus sp. HUN007]